MKFLWSLNVHLLWFFISLSCLLIVLTQTSDAPTFLNRYSVTDAVIIAVLLGFTTLSGGWWYASTIRQRPLPAISLPRFPLMGLALFCLWVISGAIIWLIPVRESIQSSLFRLYLAGLIFVVFWHILKQAAILALRLRRSWVVLTVGLAVAVTLLMVAAYQGGYVPPNRNFDEGWIAGRAVSLVDSDPETVDQMTPTRDPASSGAVANLSQWFLGMYFRLFGMGLSTGRLYGTLLSWLMLAFVYEVTRKLYGSVAAVIAVIVGLLLPLHHGYLYPTNWVALFHVAALYVFLQADQAQSPKRWPLHYLVGVLAALSIEGHAYGAAFTAGMGAFYLIYYGREAMRERRVWSGSVATFALGVLTVLMVAIAFRIALTGGELSLGNFAATLLNRYTDEATIGTDTISFPQRVLSTNVFFWLDYLNRFPVELVIFIFALVAAVRRAVFKRHRSDRLMLTVLFISTAVLGLFMAKPNVYYFIFFMPYITIFAGAACANLWQPRTQWRVAHLGAAVWLFALLAAFTVVKASQPNYNALVHLGYEIDAVLPVEADLVSGWEMYYFGLHPRRFIMLYNYYEQNREPDLPVPDALIITHGLDDIPDVLSYARQHGFQRAYCFPLDEFDGITSVYTQEEFLPADAPVNCT